MRPLLLLLGLVCPVIADSFVEWNPSVDVVADAPWRLPAEPVGPDGPRVVVKDGHFFVGGERYRAWGVNLSFGANLPAPEDAAMVAGRLAAAGVNAVRLHHMDTARYPRGLWHRDGGFRLDPEGLERLDGFIAELADRGIRINLNLHVGARYSAMLDDVPESQVNYDKLCLQFVPRLQRAWRDYARIVLGHRNPRRGGLRYAEDPAISWVEVSNENSFWFGGYLDELRDAPEYYRSMIEGQFVAWLVERHGDDAGLRKAWGVTAEPLGKDLLPAQVGADGWRIEQHEGARTKCSAVAGDAGPGVRFDPGEITGASWHLQYNLHPLTVGKGRYYTLVFRARADRPRKIGAAVGMAHEPWESLGLSQPVELGREWKEHRIGFVARQDDDRARVNFSFGGGMVPFELAGVRLHPGGQVGLGEDESLAAGRMALWGESETPERGNDRLRFLAATEKAFFDMGREFIRDEMGCGALVVGTQGYGPMGLYAQDGMDFIDSHAYWQHPHFPRKPWDSADWTIGRKALIDHPGRSTFLSLAAHRVPGRPFTVSEYNHPAPNDYQVECVPMMAAVAAIEDWDGVWFYTYEHNNDRWNDGLMGSYFDFRANPAKWAFMPAGAALFRKAGIGPAAGTFLSTLVPPGPAAAWRDPAAAMEAHRGNRGGGGKSAGELAALLHREPGRDGGGSRLFLVDGDRGAVAVGRAAGFAAGSDGKLTVESPDFCALAVVALDGGGLADCRRLLVTACGRAENRAMGFNPERTSVGRNWGEPPVRAEAVTGRWQLPAGDWRARALRADGSRGAEVPLEQADGRPVLRMSPRHRTICYLLER